MSFFGLGGRIYQDESPGHPNEINRLETVDKDARFESASVANQHSLMKPIELPHIPCPFVNRISG